MKLIIKDANKQILHRVLNALLQYVDEAEIVWQGELPKIDVDKRIFSPDADTQIWCDGLECERVTIRKRNKSYLIKIKSFNK